ncbi:hypothetical protein MPH_08583 [Macrophomina phaseolina MS6]|uniref:Uncharacterized protein n=1 Tax=Macrophomina phaseolina (strain MS6) TaxID=1126212 RepID=K2RHW5_MACPH|nr:hypothetical protein MPH_08583 [Macrophomina phaseolina MS6]
MPSQPYMYEPPQRFSATSDTLYGFDPKAVTKASRMPPKRPPPKQQDGPLIDFNKHPDSYLVTPYQSNVKPFNPRTKVAIKWVRVAQLTLRILQLIGAVGLLICVICIKGTQDTEGWIIRVPAAFDILCCLYAVYHLIRPAKSRTASSSASYHFFTLIIDTGLTPFYVFTAMLAKTNLAEAPGTEGRWRSFFTAEDATNKLLLSTWLTSVTVGALHLLAIGLGLYLVLVFRKIARLPPDMNPLEDNLTSRRGTKHKYKTSSLSEITSPPEKRFSDMSGSTCVSSPSRSSHAQDEPMMPDVRTMPFARSRRNSDCNYNPHNPHSARESRTYLPDQIYQQPRSSRASRSNVNSRTGSVSPTKLDLKSLPIKLSANSLGGYDSMSPSSSPERSPARSKHQSLKSDNWFVYPEAEAASDDDEPTANQPLVRRYSFERDDDTALYADIVANAGPLSPLSDGEQTGHLRPEPLRMNPPTPSPKNGTPPPPMPFQSAVGSISSEHSSGIGRALTINSTVTRTTDAWGYFPGQNHYHGSEPAGTYSNFSSPSRSPTRNGRGTPRYYGDLRSAPEGIAGKYNKNNDHNLLGHRLGLGANGGGTKRAMGKSPERPGYERVESSPRVVSRSGVDVDGGDAAGDLGLMRGRAVSGKMAEEGLVGVVTRRKVSGMA